MMLGLALYDLPIVVFSKFMLLLVNSQTFTFCFLKICVGILSVSIYVLQILSVEC